MNQQNAKAIRSAARKQVRRFLADAKSLPFWARARLAWQILRG